MVLLSNSASLLVLALAASLQLGTASPYPQQGITTIVPKQQGTTSAPKEGDSCNDQTDRTVCADSSSLLFCSQSKWVTYSNCTLGTVCQDGFCVYPNESSNAQDSADQQLTNDVSAASSTPSSIVVSGQSDASASTPATGATATDATSTDATATDATATDATATDATATGATASSSPAVATSAAGAGSGTESSSAGEATSAAQSSGSDEGSSSSSSDSSNGGGSSSGSSYGITCDKFDKAVSAASKAIGQNYPTPSSAQCNAFIKGMETGGAISSAREAAMFLANILWESDGLRAKEEYDCVSNPSWCAQNYKTPEDASGKTYWGRGYIQLTWEYNYKAASEGMYGNDKLVQDPDIVATDEDTAWGVSFWYWKENVHTDAKVQDGQFGASINDINGALECKGAAQDKAKKRYAMYKAILPIFAPNETPVESGCYN
ncbi:hypothetical protein GGI23_001135 [Coemansia sp. RSA 2559]|nr:hypothetical protein GGI23_001135 [Coemansia sp. RSA 2559]